jgi:hypothetical protein
MNRGTRHSNHAQDDQEDILPQAGWMYADLFLALTVIFLATISFVPAFSQGQGLNGADNSDIRVNTATSFNYSKGYTLVVPTNNIDQVPAKVTEFLREEKLDTNTEVIFVQLVGGFDPKTEQPNDGQLRAIEFAVQLNKNYPELLINAQRFIESSPNIAPGNVALRLTFARTLPTK